MRSRLAVLVLALAASCGRPGALDPADVALRRLPALTAEQRRDALRRARLFDDVDPASRNLLDGPPPFHFDERVSCDFIEPRAERVPARGTTPKFFCALRHGERDIVKVKYGRANGEVYGEILGSRLLWALGVSVDSDYAVRVRCHHCPRDPWLSYRDFPRVDPSERAVREIDDAVMQRLFPGAMLQQRRDQGWSADELDAIRDRRDEVDALRLLAAFIAHGDDKPENQRIVCPLDAVDAGDVCTAPRLLFADLGSTFGRGASSLGFIDAKSRPTFAAWSTLPMWEDRASCRAHLAARSSRANPVVSEAGRRFLAARLQALSHQQIQDLFTAARIERLGEMTHGRAVTTGDWVEAFERRRAEITETRCP